MEQNTAQNFLSQLFSMQDLAYRDFHAKLVPNIDKKTVIGIRTPVLRNFAKKFYREEPEKAKTFMEDLPHQFYEENNLHGILISCAAKTPKDALVMLDEFLPYVDNWATCDLLPPKILKKDLNLTRRAVMEWLDEGMADRQVYRVRFAIVAMLTYLLDEGFEKADLDRLAEIHTDEYYINMAIAWYYSFALIKQYENTIGLFEARQLDKWVHNKSIQKAIESYRVRGERKDYLRTLKIH